MRLRTWMMLVVALPAMAIAQGVSAWELDAAALAAGGSALLQRVPDPQADALLRSVHDAMQDERQAQALCGLFDPDAGHDLQALDAAAAQLDPASREQFATAVGDAVVAALQSPPQPDDSASARQSLMAAGVRAALLHDGFVAGLQMSAQDPGSRQQRCRSVRWLLDAMQSRPPAERAAMTRLLLQQGVSGLSAAG